MSDGESKVAVTTVRGAPATRYEGGTAGKVLQLAAGEERTLLGMRFRVEHLLSTTSSGQACVYLVRDPAGAAFALKVYHGERDAKVRPSEELLARYAALTHPNLVSVRAHGYGADGIQEAYDWELLELLEPLRFPLEDGPREAWLEQRLAPALGAAAEALLSAALVHCDIKPANVMQRPSTGEIVLVDIGSLKGVNADTMESVTTLVATTSAYAAPELLRKHVNEKTDAFSIGMTLFEFAQPGSLSSPRDKEVVARISRGQPVLDQLGSAPRLCDLVNGLTRGDLTARWGCEEFRQWVSGKQVVAPAPEITLPVIKWRKQQISTVPALLQVMADEAAFWSMCEDEGDLPHTLRQWVHTLHDETVGAALSRLVKRCLADGEPALGVTAIRRVLVPDGPFSVKGRQFGGTPTGAVDAIRAARAVPEDVEVALRLWGHDDAEGTAAALLKQLPTAAASDARTKRGGFELRVGCKAPPAGWEGAKFWLRLRRVVEGPTPETDLALRAREAILAVPVGTPDGPWKEEIEVAATLLPDSPEMPTIWQVWAAARRTMAAVAFGRTVVADEGLAVLTPAQIRAMWDWEPGKALLQTQFPSSRDAGESDAGVEAVLWESGRRWLVVGGLVLEQPKQLCEPAVEASVAKWLEGAESRRARLLRWVDASLQQVSPPPLRRGSKPASQASTGDFVRGARETLVLAFRQVLAAPSEVARQESALEVIKQVAAGSEEAPWRGSVRAVAILTPRDVVQVTNWELLQFAYAARPEVCVKGKLFTLDLLQQESVAFLFEFCGWPPARKLLASAFPELATLTRSEEAVEAVLRRSGRDWLLLGAGELQEPESLGRSESQEEVLQWLAGPPARAQRLLAWVTRRLGAERVAARSTGEVVAAVQETSAAGNPLTRAHVLLWVRGSRGVAVAGKVWLAPTDLAAATYAEIETVLRDDVGRAWLKHLGGTWSEALLEADSQLAAHRVWWQAGSMKLALDTRRTVERPEQLASLEDCELVLTTLSGRAWLERNGPPSSAAQHARTLAVGAHQLWWQAGGTSLRLPDSQRLLDGPAAVLKCSDAEMNELAASEVGRAWFRRQQIEIPQAVAAHPQVLRWALGERTIRLDNAGKSDALEVADFQRAPKETLGRIWGAWGRVTLGWLQRLVGDVAWTSVGLPDDAGAGAVGARQMAALVRRIPSVPPVLLAVRGERIDWEISEPAEASFAALIELERTQPGALRRALTTLRAQAGEVRTFLMVHQERMKLEPHFEGAMRLASSVQSLSLLSLSDEASAMGERTGKAVRLLEAIDSETLALPDHALRALQQRMRGDASVPQSGGSSPALKTASMVIWAGISVWIVCGIVLRWPFGRIAEDLVSDWPGIPLALQVPIVSVLVVFAPMLWRGGLDAFDLFNSSSRKFMSTRWSDSVIIELIAGLAFKIPYLIFCIAVMAVGVSIMAGISVLVGGTGLVVVLGILCDFVFQFFWSGGLTVLSAFAGPYYDSPLYDWHGAVGGVGVLLFVSVRIILRNRMEREERARSHTERQRNQFSQSVDHGFEQINDFLNSVRRRRLVGTVVKSTYPTESRPPAPREVLERIKVDVGVNPRAMLSRSSTELVACIERRRGRSAGIWGVFQFEVSASSPWSINLGPDGGSEFLRIGAAENPSATLTLSEADLAAMVAGTLDPVQAWQRGRLKILGNRGYALTLMTNSLRKS
jgi:hypothetical protein